MSCGEKVHIVREKRERKKQLEEEERRKANQPIPVENWPVKVPDEVKTHT